MFLTERIDFGEILVSKLSLRGYWVHTSPKFPSCCGRELGSFIFSCACSVFPRTAFLFLSFIGCSISCSVLVNQLKLLLLARASPICIWQVSHMAVGKGNHYCAELQILVWLSPRQGKVVLPCWDTEHLWTVRILIFSPARLARHRWKVFVLRLLLHSFQDHQPWIQ